MSNGGPLERDIGEYRPALGRELMRILGRGDLAGTSPPLKDEVRREGRLLEG